MDLKVAQASRLGRRYVLLRLDAGGRLPAARPGQFAQVRVDGSPGTFLRRPISICLVDHGAGELWLLVAVVGEGTGRLSRLLPGDTLNCILPLGNGFTLPGAGERCLAVGGGVGVAPLLFLGRAIREAGAEPTFLLGARTRDDLPLLDAFAGYGRVLVTTEDGSMGVRGFVTDHPELSGGDFARIYSCGPRPMMAAVARHALSRGIACEVSLENMMACGMGACLCCVENTVDGNLRVCTEGPVFDARRLSWLT